MRSSPIAAGVAVLAIATAGCASAGAGGPGAAKGAATVVPANAVGFVGASTDLSSAAWHGLGEVVLRQVPAWSKELAPVVGDEVDVAVLPGDKAVAFVQPTDESNLAALATAHGAKVRKIGDWTAVAHDAKTLDTVAGATSHLSDNTLFEEAMGRLPDGALVRAYANGGEAKRLLASLPGAQDHRWVAAAVTSTDAGLKLEAFATDSKQTATTIRPYAPALVDEIPSGALAVVDLQVPQGAFEQLPLPPALQQALGPPASSLPNRISTILGGETALYVRPALPMPEVTIVTQPADTAAASAALDDLLASLPKQSMVANLKLYRAVIGGQFVVSTTQQGIDDFRSGGAKLSADPAFIEAKKQSGMPEETTGFAYVNAKAALPLLALAGAKLPTGLPQLHTFAAYGSRSSGESTLTAFLAVG